MQASPISERAEGRENGTWRKGRKAVREQSAAAAALITPHCALGAIRRAREQQSQIEAERREGYLSDAAETCLASLASGVSLGKGTRIRPAWSCVIHAAIDSA